jgi:hypothetical protein
MSEMGNQSIIPSSTQCTVEARCLSVDWQRRNRSEGRLARDDVFAEKQAANHYHYRDGATHVTKAEADWVQKTFHYWDSTALPGRPSNQLRLSQTVAGP